MNVQNARKNKKEIESSLHFGIEKGWVQVSDGLLSQVSQLAKALPTFRLNDTVDLNSATQLLI